MFLFLTKVYVTIYCKVKNQYYCCGQSRLYRHRSTGKSPGTWPIPDQFDPVHSYVACSDIETSQEFVVSEPVSKSTYKTSYVRQRKYYRDRRLVFNSCLIQNVQCKLIMNVIDVHCRSSTIQFFFFNIEIWQSKRKLWTIREESRVTCNWSLKYTRVQVIFSNSKNRFYVFSTPIVARSICIDKVIEPMPCVHRCNNEENLESTRFFNSDNI